MPTSVSSLSDIELKEANSQVNKVIESTSSSAPHVSQRPCELQQIYPTKEQDWYAADVL